MPMREPGLDRHDLSQSFLAAREITQLAERGEGAVGPGDVGAAINGDRAVYDFVISKE